MRAAGRGGRGVRFEHQATVSEPGLYITNKAALTGKTFTRHLSNSDKPSLSGIRERSRQAVIQADRGTEVE